MTPKYTPPSLAQKNEIPLILRNSNHQILKQSMQKINLNGPEMIGYILQSEFMNYDGGYYKFSLFSKMNGGHAVVIHGCCLMEMNLLNCASQLVFNLKEKEKFTCLVGIKQQLGIKQSLELFVVLMIEIQKCQNLHLKLTTTCLVHLTIERQTIVVRMQSQVKEVVDLAGHLMKNHCLKIDFTCKPLKVYTKFQNSLNSGIDFKKTINLISQIVIKISEEGNLKVHFLAYYVQDIFVLQKQIVSYSFLVGIKVELKQYWSPRKVCLSIAKIILFLLDIKLLGSQDYRKILKFKMNWDEQPLFNSQIIGHFIQNYKYQTADVYLPELVR
eukprot:403336137